LEHETERGSKGREVPNKKHFSVERTSKKGGCQTQAGTQTGGLAGKNDEKQPFIRTEKNLAGERDGEQKNLKNTEKREGKGTDG